MGPLTDEEHRAADVCPIIDLDYREAGPALSHYVCLNTVRELGPFTWNETPRGFWMVNRYDEVREALQMNDVFTNVVTSALESQRTACACSRRTSTAGTREVSPRREPVVLSAIGEKD